MINRWCNLIVYTGYVPTLSTDINNCTLDLSKIDHCNRIKHWKRLKKCTTTTKITITDKKLTTKETIHNQSNGRMEDGGAWDLNTITEEDFDQLAVYQVQDKSADEIEAALKLNPKLTRAELSLPRNLVLKPSQEIHTDVS